MQITSYAKKNCTAGRPSDWNYLDYSTESEFKNKTETCEDIRRSSGHLNEITEGKDGSEAIFEEIMTEFSTCNET